MTKSTNIHKSSIDYSKFLIDNYIDYGTTVNKYRAIPGTDGLKPVHRRVLMGLKDCANGKLIGSVTAIGAIQKYHSFGDASIIGVLSDMARLGAIDSHGAVGVKLIESLPPAAPRYTKSGLTKEQFEYWFRLIDYSPIVESDVGLEPEYLITPIPYCLVYGALNWGLGVLGRTPAFTYDSLINAYLTDDPRKLVPQFGYICDYEKSELDKLWNLGKGKLVLSYKCIRVDNNEILICGSGEVFTPNYSALNKYIKDGKIEVINESTNQVAIRVRKIHRAHCDMDEVFQICQRISKHCREYSILIVKDDKVDKIAIKDWLNLSLTRFVNTFNQYKSDRILKLKKEIEVYKFLPEVGKLLLKNLSDEEILLKLKKLDKSVLDIIKRKSINSLRNSDSINEINKLEKMIDNIQSEDVEEIIKKPM